MGQTLSRRLASRLEQGLQKYRHEMEKDALREVAARNKGGGGGVVDSTGFQRGNAPGTVREAEQESYLRATHKGGPLEMPPELVQFLKDAGPLERKMDEQLSSPRLLRRRRQHDDDDEEEMMMTRDRHRQQREMPIMEESDVTTTRTVNFSLANENDVEKEEADDAEWGMSDQDLYRLISSSDHKEFLESKSKLTDKEREDFAKLLRQTVDCLEVPVIMKDTDKTYVGTSPERVADLTRLKLAVVPDSRIRLNIIPDDTKSQESSSQVV